MLPGIIASTAARARAAARNASQPFAARDRARLRTISRRAPANKTPVGTKATWLTDIDPYPPPTGGKITTVSLGVNTVSRRCIWRTSRPLTRMRTRFHKSPSLSTQRSKSRPYFATSARSKSPSVASGWCQSSSFLWVISRRSAKYKIFILALAPPASRTILCVEAQLLELCRSRDPLLVPAAQLVIGRQHLGKPAEHALRRAGLDRLLEEPRRKRIVLRGQSRVEVPLPLEVPDALAALHESFGRVLDARDRAEHFGEFRCTNPKSREQACPRGVERGGQVLKGDHEGRLAVGRVLVDLHWCAEHLWRYGVAANMGGTAVCRGIV